MGNVASAVCEKSLQKSIPKKLMAIPHRGSDYQLEHVKAYNKTYHTAPVAVTYPITAEHVQAIIKCANQFSMKVQARCGGHSYGNYGKIRLFWCL